MNTPAVTLAELRKRPHWSFSALNTFLNTCSLQWAFRYVWKLPSVSTPAALVFGGVFHSACTFAFRARLAGRELPLTPGVPHGRDTHPVSRGRDPGHADSPGPGHAADALDRSGLPR